MKMRFLFYACKDTAKYRETRPFRPIFIRKRLHDKNRQEYMHLLSHGARHAVPPVLSLFLHLATEKRGIPTGCLPFSSPSGTYSIAIGP